jgi:hypothetical protein
MPNSRMKITYTQVTYTLYCIKLVPFSVRPDYIKNLSVWHSEIYSIGIGSICHSFTGKNTKFSHIEGPLEQHKYDIMSKRMW